MRVDVESNEKNKKKELKQLCSRSVLEQLKEQLQKMENRRMKDGRSIPRKVQAATTG